MRFNADILVPRHPVHVPQHAPQRHHAATGEPLPDGRRFEDSGPQDTTATYNQQFQNRDPRMAQTLMAWDTDLNGIDEVIEDCKS